MKKIQKQDFYLDTIKTKPVPLFLAYGHYAKYWENDGKTPASAVAQYILKDGREIIVAEQLTGERTKEAIQLTEKDFKDSILKTILNEYGIESKDFWDRKNMI